MDIMGVKVVLDGAVEDDGVLGDDSKATSQIVKANCRKIQPIEAKIVTPGFLDRD